MYKNADAVTLTQKFIFRLYKCIQILNFPGFSLQGELRGIVRNCKSAKSMEFGCGKHFLSAFLVNARVITETAYHEFCTTCLDEVLNQTKNIPHDIENV